MELPTPQDLRERRKALELTQSKLADMAGVSQPLIARIEGGDVDPRLSTLRRIVEALDEAEGRIVRAEDIMNTQVRSVAPDNSVLEARDMMLDAGFSQLPVIENGRPLGIISNADIRHVQEDNVAERPVNEVMSESITTVEPETTLDEVGVYLDHNSAILVVEGGETVGIITEADIAAHI
ncbi:MULTISPECIES: CBS domain-containing protein [Haloferax]|uniref:CBS domain-containing protein n=2 Tax=Haloferax TaxID=2251 RepID=A0A6A8GJZ8_9EURY|nr:MULTISPECIES: CBS domain-containing protein [Haloferax]KAB1194222.1 CBS domain-containing protein [Haloferax sp. CBA1148]KTG30888.1 transcriptional regulator [Haloferax profundi]MRX22782.1 CBS domain-containing protein [Haloferax litoreum]